ncbi:MAG: uracil-DNA glycosylase [Deltaproteobacteria bacterium]|nr:uracil-DNA glycosylase [Deltaproteobacteria bacterium]MCB9489199.1 uracil-DNA glycosylase [Deltaproteobacteria bacterium]
MMDDVEQIVRMLRRYRGENVFNPYRDRCATHDLSYAARIRTENLRRYLTSLAARSHPVAIVGRDLGYRGGRRTGLPLSDETLLPLIGARYGIELARACNTGPLVERTAQELWRFAECFESAPLLWNVFPWHPHRPGEPLSNRPHTAAEARAGRDVLRRVLDLHDVRVVIALGRVAQATLASMGVGHIPIRHPSHGGQTEFRTGMTAVFGGRDLSGS